VVADDAGAWVASYEEGTVVHVDATSNRVVKRVAVGRRPLGMLLRAGVLWVAVSGEGALAAVDVSSGRVTARVAVGVEPFAIAEEHASLWVVDHTRGDLVRIAPDTRAV